jgi:ABC-type multidrug transport system fused ATPase/permease subunit
LQQGSIAIKGGLGSAGPTFQLIESLRNAVIIENNDDTLDTLHLGFDSTVEIKNSELTYPQSSEPAVSNLSLSIPAGKSVALVGPSGAGKTTLVDILLGVLSPDKGTVLISGKEPLDAFAEWPGAVSYVPQDIVISSGTVRENIALGYPLETATDEMILSALKVAHLDEFVTQLPAGLDADVGEHGSKLSGGQRQRLGIARAMFTRPHLLVLDEATSALDGETEAAISDAIHELRGSTTVVMIAHRLSTVRNADIVVYLDKGRILAQGTFDEVREAVPDFDRQAKLMGL